VLEITGPAWLRCTFGGPGRKTEALNDDTAERTIGELWTVRCKSTGCVPLSFCWRRSGTLVLPAAAHALIDAYRNMIASG
jgi:hypothetical protein